MKRVMLSLIIRKMKLGVSENLLFYRINGF